MLIYHNLLVWLIFMPVRSYFLIGIGRREIKWNTTISEVEVECQFQYSGRTNVWGLFMHVNICQVILVVTI